MGAMNIRWKVTALIAALFVALGITAVIIARNVLIPSFTALEHSEAEVAMRRVQFAHDHNATFVSEQVTAPGLSTLNINMLIFADVSGDFLATQTLDLRTNRPL